MIAALPHARTLTATGPPIADPAGASHGRVLLPPVAVVAQQSLNEVAKTSFSSAGR